MFNTKITSLRLGYLLIEVAQRNHRPHLTTVIAGRRSRIVYRCFHFQTNFALKTRQALRGVLTRAVSHDHCWSSIMIVRYDIRHNICLRIAPADRKLCEVRDISIKHRQP